MNAWMYTRKVEQAAKSRAQFLQALSDANVELYNAQSSLGEKKKFVEVLEKTSGTIKEQLAVVAPALEKVLQQKEERVKEFFDVQSQIQKIHGEITEDTWRDYWKHTETPAIDETELSLKKLDEYQLQLQELQKEKSDRLQKILELVSSVHDLCAGLRMVFFSTVTEVHPTLNDSTGVQSKSISNETLSRLSKTVMILKEDKKQRLHKLQGLASQLIDLWNLMDTSEEERRLFDHVTCNTSASVE